MAKESKNETRVQRWRNKFRFVILNDDTFEEIITLKLSPLNIFVFSIITIITTIALTTTVIAFTSLKELIPGYASSKLRREAIELALTTDSLQVALERNERYINGVKRILEGEVIDTVLKEVSGQDTSALVSLALSSPSTQDSAFREWVEQENAFTLNQSGMDLGIPQLMSPLDGIITSSFDKITGHYAIDIAAAANTPIKTCFEGTVIFADWTSETGNIIIVQHENNLISAYKHNSALLKEVGEFVRSGEAIAIIGNSGENSTGPHLHFELWYEGAPIDPQGFIKF
ncbi:MAG: peptidase M23 [Flavobacteriales bacterium]|jgi:murein DD-endopeptidase MepM/ murein hydrolase activator NlpD|nr:peptidase M23 [Flavobacteriales bacterium]|tara:strand:- start:3842 stop:4702 length:861 start_codon:yes stop_codon:yes gene_type:complete